MSRREEARVDDLNQFFGKILQSVITNLIVYFILVIISYSVVTGQFPPNFAKMKRNYGDLRKMVEISQEIHAKDKTLRKQYAETGKVPEREVETVRQLMDERTEIAANVFGFEVGGRDLTQDRILALEQKVIELENQLQAQARR